MWGGGMGMDQMQMMQMMQMMGMGGNGKGKGKGWGNGKGNGKGKGKVKGNGDKSAKQKRQDEGGVKQLKKAELNNAVTKIHGADVPKGAIAYTTEDVQGGKQSQVVISCLPNYLAGSAFAGEVFPTESAAVESAATVALDTIMSDMELKEKFDASVKKPKKQKTEGGGEPTPKKQKKAKEAQAPAAKKGSAPLLKKANLNNAVTKIMSGNVAKGSITYSTEDVQGGKQSSVTISCLPSALATSAISGEVRPTENDAIESAAQVAFDSIMADSELKELFDGKKATGEVVPRTPGEPLELTPKTKLNNAVQKIVPEAKNILQIVYTTVDAPGGTKKSSVLIGVLPNAMKTKAFAGQACKNEKEAINSAATVALKGILANKELKALYDKPKEVRLRPDGTPYPTEAERKAAKAAAASAGVG